VRKSHTSVGEGGTGVNKKKWVRFFLLDKGYYRDHQRGKGSDRTRGEKKNLNPRTTWKNRFFSFLYHDRSFKAVLSL